MEFKLPFDESVIDVMSGRTMVLAENHRNENLFTPVKELRVLGGGDCEKPWRIEVLGGCLRVLREEKLFCEFCGLESRGGIPYAVGRRVDVEHKHGFGRIVMYEKRCLKPAEYGVCVSSHVQYEKGTVEPILKSLRKTGFDMSRVVVVVDGDKRWASWSDDRADGVRVERADVDAMGFAGLNAAGNDYPYWLLVHDTCEFDRDFQDKIAGVDVGLEPDVVLLSSPEEKSEIGLYSGKFVAGAEVDIKATRYDRLFDMFMARARTVLVAPGKVSVVGSKDVYGNGVMRKVMRFESLGLKKFSGKITRGGRP